MKKETLKETAEKRFNKKTEIIPVPTSTWMDSKELQISNFIAGAKWQQERSYSEEEFKEIVYNMVGMLAQANNMTFNGAILNELFNKFKK